MTGGLEPVELEHVLVCLVTDVAEGESEEGAGLTCGHALLAVGGTGKELDVSGEGLNLHQEVVLRVAEGGDQLVGELLLSEPTLCGHRAQVPPDDHREDAPDKDSIRREFDARAGKEVVVLEDVRGEDVPQVVLEGEGGIGLPADGFPLHEDGAEDRHEIGGDVLGDVIVVGVLGGE